MYLVYLYGNPYMLFESFEDAKSGLLSTKEAGTIETVVFGRDFQDNEVLLDVEGSMD